MAAGEQFSFQKLTRRHAIKLSPPAGVSVEDCSLAVGEFVGYESIKSASRMNGAVVIFLDEVDKVNRLLESGVTINDTHTPVFSLTGPAKKVIISNAPPFLKNELLEKELGRYGKLVSPIKMIPFSCKSPQLKHVVSFRRHVYMILKKNDEELNLVFKFKVEDFDYTVHVTTELMKCFGCGAVGHAIRSCPNERRAGRLAADAAETPPAGADVGAAAPVEPREMQVSQADDRGDSGPGDEEVEDSINKQSGQKVQDISEGDLNVGHIATRVVESVLFNEEDVLMDDDFSKMSNKRKSPENKSNTEQVTKVSKMHPMGCSSQSQENLSNTQEGGSECGNTQVDAESVYSFAKIQTFLQKTKGMRSVKVDEFFPDLSLFLSSVRFFMKNTEPTTQSTFTDQEIFRLKKLMVKVKTQIATDD